MMIRIEFDDIIRQKAPEMKAVVVEATVTNDPTSDQLWALIESAAADAATNYDTPDIARRPAIASTRAAYKALGKDPNRYRPSAEALTRRAVSGKGLYRLTTLVDIINLISLRSGFSIGGFDADRIEGDTLRLGRGEAGEEFCGIGRGPLNIDGLPVYRDARGGIGTPTSDEERTKLTPQTRRLLMIINAYSDADAALQVAKESADLLRRFAGAADVQIRTVPCLTAEDSSVSVES